MPPLGPTSRKAALRARRGAYKKREANLKRIPKPAYRPPAPVTERAPARRAAPARGPTPAQLHASRVAAAGYKSQAGAVRRVAKTQKALGPGKAVRPSKGRVLHRADIAPLIAEQAYKSQGEAVKKIAQAKTVQAEAHRKVKIGGLQIDAARLSKDPAVQKAGGLKKAGLAERIIGGKDPVKLVKNIPKNFAEVAIATPSTIVHNAVRQSEALTAFNKGDFKKAAKTEGGLVKEAVQPYGELYKDPEKFMTENPVSTYLMLAPVGPKGLRAGAGRVARATRIQKLERPAATLPGTTLRQRRVGSRDVITRAKQAREDKRTPAVIGHVKTASITHPIQGMRPELHHRVDELDDWAQQHKQAAVASEARDVSQELGRLGAKKRARAVSPRKATRQAHKTEQAARGQHVETALSGAAAGARQHVDREFAHEFGTHRDISDQGHVYEPKNAPESSGKIYATRDEANTVKTNLEKDKKITWEPHVMEIEGQTAGETGGFAVVPKEAHARYMRHKRVGRGGFTGGPALRITSRLFRKSVLPTSSKWFGGQIVEGGLRSAVHGAGPLPIGRYVTGRRFLKAYEREHGKKARQALEARTIRSQQFGITGPAAEYAPHARTLARELPDSPLGPWAEAASEFAQKPGPRHVAGAYRHFAEGVFGANNVLERYYKTGMLGREVKKSQPGLIDRRILPLGKKAMTEAAQGHKGTAAQSDLGRGIDRAYGQYTKLDPDARDVILHTTPFFPWLFNMGKFLTTVLPKDHPVLTSVLTSISEADKEWRKEHDLSFYGDQHVPDWMLGSYPTKSGGYIPAARFMPFLPGDWPGTIGGQVYPQIAGALMNLSGVDWKGNKIPGGPGRQVSNAALTEAEALIPGVGVASRVSGLGDIVRGKTDKPSVVKGDKTLGKAVLDVVNPVKPIGGSSSSSGGVKVKPVKIKPIKVKPIKVKRVR
jgi:hypothetical protein